MFILSHYCSSSCLSDHEHCSCLEFLPRLESETKNTPINQVRVFLVNWGGGFLIRMRQWKATNGNLCFINKRTVDIERLQSANQREGYPLPACWSEQLFSRCNIYGSAVQGPIIEGCCDSCCLQTHEISPLSKGLQVRPHLCSPVRN